MYRARSFEKQNVHSKGGENNIHYYLLSLRAQEKNNAIHVLHFFCCFLVYTYNYFAKTDIWFIRTNNYKLWKQYLEINIVFRASSKYHWVESM